MGIVPFSAFGTDSGVNWFRASVGGCSHEDIEQMIPRMRAALSKLK
jgi:aspartate aminotransferase